MRRYGTKHIKHTPVFSSSLRDTVWRCSTKDFAKTPDYKHTKDCKYTRRVAVLKPDRTFIYWAYSRQAAWLVTRGFAVDCNDWATGNSSRVLPGGAIHAVRLVSMVESANSLLPGISTTRAWDGKSAVQIQESIVACVDAIIMAAEPDGSAASE